MTSETKKFSGVTYTFRANCATEAEANAIKADLMTNKGYYAVMILDPNSERNPTSNYVVYVRKSSPDGVIQKIVEKILPPLTLSEKLEKVLVSRKDSLLESVPYEKRKTALYAAHEEIKNVLSEEMGELDLDLKWTCKTDEDDTSRRLMARNSDGRICAIVMGGKLSMTTYLNGIGIFMGKPYSKHKNPRNNWGVQMHNKVFGADS